MLKKIVIAVILCLSLSPVFVYIEYALGKRINMNNSGIYFDIRVFPWRDFNYYLLYSKFEYTISEDSFSFVIEDYTKSINSFRILSISTIINDNTYIVNDFINNDVLLDKSNGNTNGGDAGIAIYDFAMPKLPNKEFNIEVEGVITYNDGKQEQVSINIPRTMYHKKDTMFFFMYQLEKLKF